MCVTTGKSSDGLSVSMDRWWDHVRIKLSRLTIKSSAVQQTLPVPWRRRTDPPDQSSPLAGDTCKAATCRRTGSMSMTIDAADGAAAAAVAVDARRRQHAYMFRGLVLLHTASLHTCRSRELRDASSSHQDCAWFAKLQWCGDCHV
jgi:hypothetical protein